MHSHCFVWALRLLLLFWAILLVPAYLIGSVSLWCFVFVIATAVLFRAFIVRINDQIDEENPTRYLKYHARFYLSCLECAGYVFLSLILFLAYFEILGGSWPMHGAIGLDRMIDFLGLFSFASFTDLGDPYDRPELFALSIISIFVRIMFVTLFIIAGKSTCAFGVRTLNPIHRGRNAGELIKKFKLSEWSQGNFMSLILFSILILSVSNVGKNLELFYVMALNDGVTFLSMQIMFAVSFFASFFIFYISIIVFLRVFELFFNFRRLKHE